MVVPLAVDRRLLGGLRILWNGRQLGGGPPDECAEDRRGLSTRTTRNHDAHGLARTLLLCLCLHI